jgi:hypothetical protein
MICDQPIIILLAVLITVDKIRLLAANRHWERLKFIIAFVDRRLSNAYCFFIKSTLYHNV